MTAFVNSSFCQTLSIPQIGFVKGFIITNKGDTIKGLISSQRGNWLNTSFYYRPEKNDAGILMQASDTRGYIIFDQRFISHEIHLKDRDTTAFIKVLFDGKYSLYSYELPGHSHFIIKQPNGNWNDIEYPPVLTVKEYQSGMTSHKRFHMILDSIFYKDSFMRGLASEALPDEISMLNLFKRYHKGTGQPYVYPIHSEKSFDAGPVAGVTFDRFTMDTPHEIKSYSDPSPYAGFYLCLRNKKSLTGIFLQASMALKSHHYSYMTESPEVKSYYQTNFRSMAADARAGISINPFKKMALRPLIEGGVIVSKYLNPKYENYLDRLFPEVNSIFTYRNETVMNKDLFYGGFLRAGITKTLKRSGSLKVSAGYDYLKSSGIEKIGSVDLSIAYIPKFK